MTELTKLEDFLMKEVSGVDDPANQLPGWMVAKAAPGYPVGPDQTWDVAAAEKRVRAKTGAKDAPNASYAKGFLFKGGDGTKFGDYKFLVTDVVDGKLMVMPAAIRAAAQRLSGSSLSADEKASVGAAIKTLESRAGIGEANKAEDAPTLLGKVRNLLWPSEPTTTPEGDIDMTSEELVAALDERLGPIASKVEDLAKSVEAATPSESAPEPTGEPETKTPDEPATPALTIEDIAKAIETALEPYNEILEKVIDRIEGTEKALALGTRKSLVGQESNEDETPPSTPDLGAAIQKALLNPSTSARAIATQ